MAAYRQRYEMIRFVLDGVLRIEAGAVIMVPLSACVNDVAGLTVAVRDSYIANQGHPDTRRPRVEKSDRRNSTVASVSPRRRRHRRRDTSRPLAARTPCSWPGHAPSPPFPNQRRRSTRACHGTRRQKPYGSARANSPVCTRGVPRLSCLPGSLHLSPDGANPLAPAQSATYRLVPALRVMTGSRPPGLAMSLRLTGTSPATARSAPALLRSRGSQRGRCI